MNLNDTLAKMMGAARDCYQTDRKLSFADLTGLLKPAPNLLSNTDDFSGDWFVTDGSNVIKPGNKEFQGLKTYTYKENSGGRGVSYAKDFDSGNYTFSLFIYYDGDGSQRDALDVRPLLHIPFNLRKGWNRYVFPFNVEKKFNSILPSFWTATGGMFAGYKLERGSVATPYLRKDGVLVKAPEIIVGGDS